MRWIAGAGIIGVMWSVAWFAVVYDSPAQHPRISEAERNYLLKALPQDNSTKGVSPYNVLTLKKNQVHYKLDLITFYLIILIL